MTTSGIRSEAGEQFTTLTIDRPEYRNKVNEAALLDLRAALVAAQAADRRPIVITGVEELFCTGGAVDSYPTEFSVERHQSFSRAFVDFLLEMGRCTVPIIARINGDCFAGGTMILSRCDLAVSVDTARFGLPELDFGGFPMMALATAIDQFPQKLIFDMAYLGRMLDAQEALGLHLVNRVVARGALDATIAEIVATLATRSSAAISYGRQTYYSLLRATSDARLEQSRAELTVSAASELVRNAARQPDRGSDVAR